MAWLNLYFLSVLQAVRGRLVFMSPTRVLWGPRTLRGGVCVTQHLSIELVGRSSQVCPYCLETTSREGLRCCVYFLLAFLSPMRLDALWREEASLVPGHMSVPGKYLWASEPGWVQCSPKVPSVLSVVLGSRKVTSAAEHRQALISSFLSFPDTQLFFYCT